MFPGLVDVFASGKVRKLDIDMNCSRIPSAETSGMGRLIVALVIEIQFFVK